MSELEIKRIMDEVRKEERKGHSIGETDTLAILQNEFDNYGVEYSHLSIASA